MISAGLPEPTSKRIEMIKRIMIYSHKRSAALHEHDDCIRIAYQWLDAQVRLKHPRFCSAPLKHIIEAWGERYVSQSDVEVAAELHPEVRGVYPFFNISARRVWPSKHRLVGIGEAGKHRNYGERLRGGYGKQGCAGYHWLEAEDGSLTKLRGGQWD